PLASGETGILPLLVFAFIPLGTIVYLVLVDTLLPPEGLAVPKTDAQPLADFGLATVKADAPLLPPAWQTAFPESKLPQDLTDEEKHAARAFRRKVAAERSRMHMHAAWTGFVSRMIARPTDALEFSGILGLAIIIGGGVVVYTRGLTGNDLNVVATGIAMAALVCAALPVALFHEIRVRRARKVEESLPENLTKLAILLERASAATGSLREVLGIAADDANKREHLRATRRQSMLSYVVIIYIVFAVFLYVLFMVAQLFYGPAGLGSAAASQSG